MNIRELVMSTYGNIEEVSMKQIRSVPELKDKTPYEIYKYLDSEEISKIRHGYYSMKNPSAESLTPIKNVVPLKASPPKVASDAEEFTIQVPDTHKEFVSMGSFPDIKNIVESKEFFPVFISGMSGNGKTMMVEQAAAVCGRKFVRVQISPETDEIDLIGGFRLIDGNTVFVKGPVIRAMEEGAILLIDEIDRSSHNLIVLNGILEGKPYFIKKTGETITPAHGFNVFATANTLGRGSADGRYSASIIMDDALLERFVMVVNQKYPSLTAERNILKKHVAVFGYNVPDQLIENLVNWSKVIRKTFDDGGVDDLVTTRRLTHILKIYNIFQNTPKAIKYGVSRFDEDTASAFITLYKAIDAAFTEEEEEVEED